MRAQTAANRINQVTPYGSLTYTQNTGRTFNQAAYDAAMQNYYNQLSNPQQSSTPARKGMFGLFMGRLTNAITNTGSKQGQKPVMPPVMPNEADFWSGGNPDGGWTATQTLSPDQQKILEQNTRLGQGLLGTAEKGLGYVDKLLENPQLDTSNLPQINPLNQGSLSGVRNFDASGLNDVRGIDLNSLPRGAVNAGQTAQQAILSRLNPQLQQQEEALRTRLANQGITLGSDAYNREMLAQGQRANDLITQAALQGISLDQAVRQQAFGEQQALSANDLARRQAGFGERQAMSQFDAARRQQGLQEQLAFAGNAADTRARMLQEQAYMQDRPLNVVNALRTGNQVQGPQFVNAPQQGFAPGPDMLGAAQSQYQANLGAYNAKAAQQGGLMGGLFSLGGAALGSPWLFR